MNDRALLEVAVDNPDRAFVAEAVAVGRRNVPLDMSPALSGLATMLIEGSPGELSVGFTAGETTTQGNGVVAGGTVASMLDIGMAMAVLSLLKPGQSCATISLTVNMQRAAPAGSFVVLAGVDRVGGRVAFAHAQLFDAQRRHMIANATSSLAVIDVKA